MLKNILFLLLSTTLLFSSCKDDDDVDLDDDPNTEISYPVKAVYQGITSDAIEVWQKLNDQVGSVALDDTSADEDEFFTEVLAEEDGFNCYLFSSETEVEIIYSEAPNSADTIATTYTHMNNELTIPFNVVLVPFDLTGIGNPTDFKIVAQAYLIVDSGTTSGFASVNLTDVESLKAGLENGQTLAVMNYYYNYSE